MSGDTGPNAYNQVSKQGSSYLRLSAGRACQRCRQQRIRCDLGKPCTNCVKAGEDCKHVDVSVACFCCSRSKVKCDKQRPCARCVKRGKPDECYGPEIHEMQNEQGAGPVPLSPSPVPARSPSTLPAVKNEPHSHPASASAASSCNCNHGAVTPATPPTPASPVPNVHISACPNGAQSVRSTRVMGHARRGSGGETAASEAGTPNMQDEEDWAQDILGKKRKWEEEDVNTWQGDDEQDNAVSIYPQRPLKFRCTLTFQDLSMNRAKMMLKLQHTVLRRMWDAGYSASALMKLFSSLPPDVRSIFDQGLEAMETLQAFKIASATDASSSEAGDGSGWMSEMMQEDDNMFLRGCGLWTVTIDPRTSRRLTCQINEPLGRRVIDMHPEEMLARAGHSDLSLPHSELEFFCNLMDDILSTTQPVVTRYVRITRSRNGRMLDSVLCRRKVHKSFNCNGQLVQVQNVITPITAEEYDRALEVDPTACRPMMRFLDDDRKGQDLLDDACRDILFEETFEQMSTRVDGIMKLSKLSNLLRANFEPYIRMAADLRAKMPNFCPPQHSYSPAPTSVDGMADDHAIDQGQDGPFEIDDGLHLPADFGSDWMSHSEEWSTSPSPLRNAPIPFQENFAPTHAAPRNMASRTDPLF